MIYITYVTKLLSVCARSVYVPCCWSGVPLLSHVGDQHPSQRVKRFSGSPWRPYWLKFMISTMLPVAAVVLPILVLVVLLLLLLRDICLLTRVCPAAAWSGEGSWGTSVFRMHHAQDGLSERLVLLLRTSPEELRDVLDEGIPVRRKLTLLLQQLLQQCLVCLHRHTQLLHPIILHRRTVLIPPPLPSLLTRPIQSLLHHCWRLHFFQDVDVAVYAVRNVLGGRGNSRGDTWQIAQGIWDFYCDGTWNKLNIV